MASSPPSPAAAASPAGDSWPELKELVADLLELPATERDVLLAARCHGRDGLRTQALALLGAAHRDDDFLAQPLAALTAIAPAAAGIAEPLAPGTRCGPYRIEALLGEGGFSEVYRAHQQQPFERTVALKLLKPGMDTRSLLQRFALERHTLARLEHPGIARILDAGATDSGRPFVVVEFVAGSTLLHYASEHRLDLRQRLSLFVQVCTAVTHAHQRGVIHRDLKPANLMVALVDGRPQAKVIDFGIAKVLRDDLGGDERADGSDRDGALARGDDGHQHTEAGLLLGTPAYCSPEQRSGDVDVRSDVFALGAVLSELVTGQRPHPEVPLPSPWPADAPRELGWIAAKATVRARDQRYADVAALDADVQAFLVGRALAAGPATRRYRLAAFARTHRAALAIASTVLLALLGGGTAATIGFVRADRARAEAEQARRESDATADYLERLIAEVAPGRAGRDVKLVDLLAQSGPLLQRAESNAEVAARLRTAVGRAYQALGEFAAAAEHLRAALATYERLRGAGDWQTIVTGIDLVSVLQRAGDVAAAEPLLADFAARAIAARGDDHPRARTVVDLQAKLAFDRGRPADAEAPLRRLLALDEADGHTDQVVRTLGNLAQVLLGRRALDEATALAARGAELAHRTFGDDHPLTLSAVRKQAAVASSSGDQAAAVVLLAPLLPRAQKVLGGEHVETLGIANTLAFAHQLRGELTIARTLYDALLPAQDRRLGRLHPQVLMARQNHGWLLFELGEFAAAEAALRDAQERFQALRGADDLEALRCDLRRARAIAAQQRDRDSYAAFASALPAWQRTAAADDGLLLASCRDWAAVLERLGRRPDAEGDSAATPTAADWLRVQSIATAAGDAELAARAAAGAGR